MPVFFEQMFFKGARVHTDTDGDVAVFARAHNFGNLVLPADVPGIDPETIHALLHRLERKAVVEVDIRDQRELRAFSDLAERFRRIHVRYRQPNDLTARLLKMIDLLKRLRGFPRVRIAHGLDSHGRSAADLHVAESYLSGFFPYNDITHTFQHNLAAKKHRGREK
jgi:light-regulated signal transduction histidine kinase (bacteriophytochrome)